MHGRFRNTVSENAIGHAARAFTLVEMVVVVAIVLVILGVVLPAATALWRDRRIAESENTVQGVLIGSRMRALEADGRDTGLLFFVDDRGSQRILSIRQAVPPPAAIATTTDPWGLSMAYRNVFEVTADRDDVLPAPMRVAPRLTVEDAAGASRPSYTVYSDQELANNDFGALSVETNQAQRHRNFFTVVFSTDGELLAGRDVLIRDEDKDDNGHGDRTGLEVAPTDDPATEYYWVKAGVPAGNKSPDEPTPIAAPPLDRPVEFLIADDGHVALNFPSVDGLLVYDDSLYQAVPTDQKRDFLRRSAQPLYVSRFTGKVVRGDVGDSVIP